MSRSGKDTTKLPSVSNIGSDWISSVRTNLKNLITEIGIIDKFKLGTQIRRNGLSEYYLRLPLFEESGDPVAIRKSTIHQVKGESIDSVLVIGSEQFWNSVVKSVVTKKPKEDRRLAYVAMTRTRHQLVVGLLANHFDKHKNTWIDWGFRTMSE